MIKETDEAVAKRRREFLEARHKDDLTHVMSTESGRRVLGQMIVGGGLFDSSFLKSAGDRHKTDFYEGMRYLALILYKDLRKHCPDLLNTLQGELDHETKRKVDESN